MEWTILFIASIDKINDDIINGDYELSVVIIADNDYDVIIIEY